MPAGTYEHLGAGGVVRLLERFRCAAGGSGWRYVSELSTPDGRDVGSVDLTLGVGGLQLRVSVRSGGWSVRGGVSGRELLWVRRPGDTNAAEAREEREQAQGFTGVSPAFLVATAALVPRTGEPLRVRLVELSDVLGARRLDQQWRLTGTDSHRADLGVVEVSAYERIDLETAERETVHIAGDVVLAAASIGLAELDSPPGRALHDLR
ncbi:MAG: hypothetical protein H0V64_10510 [Geodermatophilaceae bacterium]|nr:hypothetical protein [Geodermatophilaceae bacterium]MDQ3466123.1 hypothetical protein [Actinomycetota bacterium]